MKILISFILALTLLSCKQVESSNDVEQVYLLNKDKDLSIFKNWVISYREGKDDLILFDYFSEEIQKFRFIVVIKDSIIYREIFPKESLPFLKLEDTDSNNTNILSYSLYKHFEELEVDAIRYRYEDKLYFLDENSATLIFTEYGLEHLMDSSRYEHYTKISKNWYYYNREEE